MTFAETPIAGMWMRCGGAVSVSIARAACSVGTAVIGPGGGNNRETGGGALRPDCGETRKTRAMRAPRATMSGGMKRLNFK